MTNYLVNGKAIAIAKPEKPSDSASSYRPTCMVSCLRKMFEKLFHIRQDYWIESKSIMSHSITHNVTFSINLNNQMYI